MGVEAVWASYPGHSTRTAEARRGDSGEACGKHGTQWQAKALVVKQIVQGVLKQR